MCTVLLRLGVNPIAVNKYINIYQYISFIFHQNIVLIYLVFELKCLYYPLELPAR